MDFINWHGHTDASNHNNRDSIIKTEQMIDIALELGHSGVGITDHAILSNHIKAIKHLDKLRKEVDEKLKKEPFNVLLLQQKDKLDKFKLGLGCEIYLVNKDEVEQLRSENQKIKFYHLVMLPKDFTGYRQLAKISTKGWVNSFYYRGLERTPVYKDDLKEIVGEQKGHLIVTSACLGSEFATYITEFLMYRKLRNTQMAKLYQDKIIGLLKFMQELFGEDFYIELQPNHGTEQVEYNKFALQLAKSFNIKAIIATDAHYHSLETKETHKYFLLSQNAERETEEFYSSTYMMNVEEIRSYFSYLSEDDFAWLISNTMEIGSKIEEIDLYKPTQVPDATIVFDKSHESTFAKIRGLSFNFPYIYKYLNSEYLIDRIILQQIEKGMEELNQEYNTINLERINEELESMWKVSEGLGQRLSSYYVLTKEIVDLIWEVSFVGVSRGSAGSFYISYLLQICQINPIEHELPAWRHLDSTKIELADIDLDSESAQRDNILERVKDKYGEDRVLTIATFKTEGSVSALQTICRGMGISINDSKYLSSLVPREGVNAKSISYCLENYGKDEKCTKFINELKVFDAHHKGFIKNIQLVEGLICGKSSHASGVYIFKDDYTEVNAMMKTPKGLCVTQYDMLDSDYQSGLKLDFLTIESLDRMRKCVDLLLKHNIIQWQGSLRATYNKYLHPDQIDMTDERMFEALRQGDILDAFQYDSVAGVGTISKIQPNSFRELMDGNALMRLNPKDVELPIDVYVRHKKDINTWYEHMRNAGLNEEEMEVLKKYLGKSYGVAPTQESIMRLSMDEKISGFDLVNANKLRKSVAKAYAKHLVTQVYKMMMKEGKRLGNREVFIQYVWDNYIVPQLNYAFSEPHLAGYTLILMQELNLAVKYPSLYWKVACLSVSAGNISDEVNKGTDYGAIAKAVAKMEKGFVLPPCINKAQMEFIPLKTENKAMYSLNAINGIGEEVARNIINNRPYASFEDFISKCVATKLVPVGKVYNLIKAGCFDEFEKDRRKLMMQYIVKTTEKKEKLTTSNLNKVIEYNLLPKEHQSLLALVQFRKEVFKKENLAKKLTQSTALFYIPALLQDFFFNNYAIKFDKAIDSDDNGELCLHNKRFDTVYKEIIKPISDWLSTEGAVQGFNNHLFSMNWDKYCQGSVEKWEMDSICYYTKRHELDSISLEQYPIKYFSELDSTPKITKTYKWKDTEYHEYQLDLIAGTVVDKNKNKSMITIVSQNGDVVDIKLDKGKFSYYDRATEFNSSWLTRGNKLMVLGFRRGEVFYPKRYKQSIYPHSIMRIDDSKLAEGKISIINNKESVDWC
jgi:DNA polymerase-3 subunit alpha